MVECEFAQTMGVDYYPATGFNRYMVECECVQQLCYFPISKPVLIDTWWNVNDSRTIYLTDSLFVLIDTWWNVNLSH